MAHKILFEPDPYIIPAGLDGIAVQVDGSFVDILLSRQEDAESVTVFRERFYPYNGKVTLCDLASLVINEMRSAGISFSAFKLTAFSDSTSNNADSKTFGVIFCDRFTVCNGIRQFLRENFLSTLACRRVAPGSSLPLSLFAEKGESTGLTVHYECRKKDGSTFTNSMTRNAGGVAAASGVVETAVNLSTILEDAASFAGTAQEDLCLLSFSVNCGKRAVTCFVDTELDGMGAFLFRNCFNAWEYVCLPAYTVAKTTTDSSAAVVNGKSCLYDRSAERIYEVQAGPLLPDEVEWIDQMFTSYEVLRLEYDGCDDTEPYIQAPVIITDCTCEMADADDKPNTVKFSWRHSDRRPPVHLPLSPGIFSSQFDFRFS